MDINVEKKRKEKENNIKEKKKSQILRLCWRGLLLHRTPELFWGKYFTQIRIQHQGWIPYCNWKNMSSYALNKDCVNMCRKYIKIQHRDPDPSPFNATPWDQVTLSGLQVRTLDELALAGHSMATPTRISLSRCPGKRSHRSTRCFGASV